MGNRTATQSTSATDTFSTSYGSNRLNQYKQVAASWGSGANTQTGTLTYDASGNLTKVSSVGTGSGGSGTTEYSFDDADRLTSVVYKNGSGVNLTKSEYVYDGISRLRVSKEFSWVNNAWSQTSEKRRVYDGMNVVQERDSTNAPVAFYTRGSDMGGGIGGLLARSVPNGQNTDHFFYHYDGRGNVVQLTDSNQATAASYKYSAFGTVSSSGAQANANPYQFSTKEVVGGLVYFGYRFYSPGMGRWLNRDPIREIGGLNIYGFVSNNPVSQLDRLGLQPDVQLDMQDQMFDVLEAELEGIVAACRRIFAGDYDSAGLNSGPLSGNLNIYYNHDTRTIDAGAGYSLELTYTPKKFGWGCGYSRNWILTLNPNPDVKKFLDNPNAVTVGGTSSVGAGASLTCIIEQGGGCSFGVGVGTPGPSVTVPLQ